MMRSLFWILAILAVLGIATPEVPVFGVDSAYSQATKKKKRPNLFQLLFKGKRRKRRTGGLFGIFGRKKREAKTTERAKRIVVPVIAKVEKLETAAKVLVIGDFMADGLAWGLDQYFVSDPNVVFIEKAQGLSGIVRQDVVNWSEELKSLLEELKPSSVVVMVGMNDRQQMRTSDGKLDKLTEEWIKEYQTRVTTLATTASANNLVWVGLPPVKSGAMNADYLVFNEIYRTQTEAVGGTFVDVWDGYTNAEGKFISAGPDVKGQIVRLRSSDGINMTKAGRRKLGFYAEKAVRRAAGLGADNLFASFPALTGSSQTLRPEYDPVKTGKTIIVSLEGPALDGGITLEGGKDFLHAKDADKSVSYELVTNGNLAAPHAGRIDAGWGPPKPAKPISAKKPIDKPVIEKQTLDAPKAPDEPQTDEKKL